MTISETIIIETVIDYYPEAQAVYLFGSHGTEEEWPDSDVDIAVLLPPGKAKKAGSFAMSDLKATLETAIKKDVDLINLRLAPTVLRKEIIMSERRIYTGDLGAAEEFEMLTLSYYQKLNEERAGIIESALDTGRFHNV